MLNRFRIFSLNTRYFSSSAISFRQKSNNDADLYDIQINNEHREFHNLFQNTSKSRSTGDRRKTEENQNLGFPPKIGGLPKTDDFNDEAKDFRAFGADRSRFPPKNANRANTTQNRNFGFHSNNEISQRSKSFHDGKSSSVLDADKRRLPNSVGEGGKLKLNESSELFSKAKLMQKNEGDDLFGDDDENLTIVGADKFDLTKQSNKDESRPTSNVVSMKNQMENSNVPLEVLIRPDIRDLYSEETIRQSMETLIDEIRPSLRPFTFDLAYLINESATLKRFVEMGVDVYRWNEPKEKAKYILTLNFERDCMAHLIFLNDLGLKKKKLNEFLSYNPWIFKETIDDLRVRVNYLKSLDFDDEQIRDVCSRAPFLLNLSTKTLDAKFQWFMKKFQLDQSQGKEFVVLAPKLLTLPLKGISNTYFNMNQQLNFSSDELKEIFRVYPKIFIYDYKLIELNFDFLFNEMEIPRSAFLLYPPVLKQSFQKLRTRCLYLKYLKRAQFDPTKANFVSLKDLCLKTNDLFCQNVTKTTVQHYLKFMKTL